MSDQTDTPQEKTPETSETPAPWGDDFNPERAWSTIQHQRSREAELEPKAKQYERLASGEDPDGLKEILEAYGYEISDTDNDETDEVAEEWEDPSEAKLSALEKRLEAQEQVESERQAAAQVQAFESQIDTLAKAKNLELSEWDKKALFVDAFDGKGFTAKKVESVFNQFAEAVEQRNKSIIEGYTKSKTAPRGPVSGESASSVPDLDSNESIVDHIKSRLVDA